MSLDADSSRFIEMVSRSRTKAITEMTPAEMRAGTARMRPLFGHGPQMLRVEDFSLGEGARAFSVRLLEPSASPRALIVYLHGGGWVTGHIDDFDVLARKLAMTSGCGVLMVNYRLAPEHPFPAALEDTLTALKWAVESAHVAGRPVILLGDSAGANLATVAARHSIRTLRPAAQILIYPVTDADFKRPSYSAPETQGLLTGETMRWYWDRYIPRAADRLHPDATPLNADSAELADLPPTLLLTAECDPLRDEGEAYAARLVQAGVTVQFERMAGQIHGFFTMTNVLPASDLALSRIDRFIDATLSN